MAGDQCLRQGNAKVVLRHKRLKHLGFKRSGLVDSRFSALKARFVLRHVIEGHGMVDLRWVIGSVAEMTSASNHGQNDAGPTAFRPNSQDIDIAIRRCVHGLLMQYPGQGVDLIPGFRGLLEFQPFRTGKHSRLESRQHLPGFTFQKGACVGDVRQVGFSVNAPHTRCRAPFDLKQQAGSCTVGKDRVLTGPKPEYLLQQQDRVFDGPSAWIWTEILVTSIHRTPVIRDTRKPFGAWNIALLAPAPSRQRHSQIGVTLVVPKQDVELRTLCLDEIVFEQECLCLRSNDSCLDADDPADHVTDPGPTMIAMKVGRDPPFQVSGLADIEQHAFGVEIAVHAG